MPALGPPWRLGQTRGGLEADVAYPNRHVSLLFAVIVGCSEGPTEPTGTGGPNTLTIDGQVFNPSFRDNASGGSSDGSFASIRLSVRIFRPESTR